jgi:hypothetical protein
LGLGHPKNSVLRPNLDAMLLTVHDGKGQKDRSIRAWGRALREIREQMGLVRRLHTHDLGAGYAGTFLTRQRWWEGGVVCTAAR